MIISHNAEREIMAPGSKPSWTIHRNRSLRVVHDDGDGDGGNTGGTDYDDADDRGIKGILYIKKSSGSNRQ